MQRFILIVVLAAAIGGLAAFGAIEALASRESRELKIGDVTIPVGVSAQVYDAGQLRLAIGAAALLSAVAALGLAEAIRGRRRR